MAIWIETEKFTIVIKLRILESVWQRALVRRWVWRWNLKSNDLRTIGPEERLGHDQVT